jgi:hypothetical protein
MAFRNSISIVLIFSIIEFVGLLETSLHGEVFLDFDELVDGGRADGGDVEDGGIRGTSGEGGVNDGGGGVGTVGGDGGINLHGGLTVPVVVDVDGSRGVVYGFSAD